MKQKTTLRRWMLSAFVLFFLSTVVFAEESALSDTDIQKILIQSSIRSYQGNCPCPYNRASNGSRCGKRSAWSRAGGYSPICYAGDISEVMINKYRSSQGE